MYRSILLFLPAKNFNEHEFTVVKKALEVQGMNIFIASDTPGVCVGNNGLRVKADVSLINGRASNFKALILIGGDGARNYWENASVHKLLKDFHLGNKLIGAICSAPVTLAKAGLLNGKEGTCFIDDKKAFLKSGALFLETPVVVSDNIITAQNPMAASEFVQTILDHIKN